MTQQYLDALSAGGAHATFFDIGNNIWDGSDPNPDHMSLYTTMAPAEVAAGDIVGDHSLNHESYTGASTGQPPLTDAQETAQVQGQQQIAAQQLPGYTENLFRPPYGDMNQQGFNLLQSLGFTDVMWTTDTNDWQSPPTATIVQRFLAGATDQAVILQHDGYPSTVAAIPQELAGLKSMGLCPGKIVPTSTPNPKFPTDYNGLPNHWQVVPF